MLTLPKNLTLDMITDAVQRANATLDNPGFCLGCGNEADGCEPDAQEYECEICGQCKVYGAEQLLIMFA